MISAVISIICGLVALAVGIGGAFISVVMFLGAQSEDDDFYRLGFYFLAFCGFAMSIVSALYGIQIVIVTVLPGV